MTTRKKWTLFANVGLALTAILGIVNGVIEQKQMEAQIRQTVEEVLAE